MSAIRQTLTFSSEDTTEAPGAPPRLVMDETLLESIVQHLRGALPNEGCGMLATERQPTGEERARRFFPGTNIDHSPVRFTMDPREVLAAFQAFERGGWRAGAIVHGHPCTPATPSPTDLREARYLKLLTVIVSFADDTPVMRAWRISRDAPGSETSRETPIVIMPGGRAARGERE